MKMQTGDITPTMIRTAAMDLLTGREFSRSELDKKLRQHFDGHSAIAGVLERLQAEGLQSDQRFTEAFLRSRIYRGHGLNRIRLDIRQKGIGESVFNLTVEQDDTDWFALAADVAKRKFGLKPIKDQKDKAKRMRFMQYRGFNYEQINYALSITEYDQD